MKPVYLVDECAVLSEEEKKTGEYTRLKKFAKPYVSDPTVLKIAVENQLVVITADIRMILRACLTGVNIIYQDHYGEKYYIYGSKTQSIGKTKMIPRTHDNNRTRMMKMFEKVSSHKLSISGIPIPSCF